MRVIHFVILLLILTTVGCHEDGPGVDWSTSLEAAKEKANNMNGLVMIYFTQPGCGFCKKMDREAFLDPSIVHYSKYLGCFKADISKPDGKKLGDFYDIPATPSLVIMKTDGTIVSRLAGARSGAKLLENLRDAYELAGMKFPET